MRPAPSINEKRPIAPAGWVVLVAMALIGIGSCGCCNSRKESEKTVMTAPSTQVQCGYSEDPQNGGQIIIQDPTGPVHVVVDSTGIYWTSIGSGKDAGFVRKRAPNSTEWTTLANKQNGFSDFIADNVHLYWITNGKIIMRVAKSGGSPSIFKRENSSITQIAVDESNIYWAQVDKNNYQIVMAPKTGGPKQVLAHGQGDLGVSPIALTIERVFWSSHDGSYILQSVSKRGGDIVVVSKGSSDGVYHDKVDAYGAKDNIVYWTTDAQLFYKIGDGQQVRMPGLMFPADDILMRDGHNSEMNRLPSLDFQQGAQG